MLSDCLATQKFLSNRVSKLITNRTYNCVSIFGTHNGLTVVTSVKFTTSTTLNSTLIKIPVSCCPTSFRFLYFAEHTENNVCHNIIEKAFSVMLRKVDKNKGFHVD